MDLFLQAQHVRRVQQVIASFLPKFTTPVRYSHTATLYDVSYQVELKFLRFAFNYLCTCGEVT
jgi:hypothetical protein